MNRQFAAAWKRKRNFGHSMSDWSDLVDETFAGLVPQAPSRVFFPELYDLFAQADAWRVFDDVRPTLEALRARGLKLAALSNWDERLRPLLRALDLDGFFEFIVISREAGFAKPDPALFRLASYRLQIPAHEILHVGDSQTEDCEGARAAGFQSRLLRRSGSALELDQISDLKTLLSLLIE